MPSLFCAQNFAQVDQGLADISNKDFQLINFKRKLNCMIKKDLEGPKKTWQVPCRHP